MHQLLKSCSVRRGVLVDFSQKFRENPQTSTGCFTNSSAARWPVILKTIFWGPFDYCKMCLLGSSFSSSSNLKFGEGMRKISTLCTFTTFWKKLRLFGKNYDTCIKTKILFFMCSQTTVCGLWVEHETLKYPHTHLAAGVLVASGWHVCSKSNAETLVYVPVRVQQLQLSHRSWSLNKRDVIYHTSGYTILIQQRRRAAHPVTERF